MPQADMTKFRELLRRAIGDWRTQSEFAKDIGITPVHISRMLKEDYEGVPSRSTLIKIADNSEGRVTLAELMTALALPIEDSEDFLMKYEGKNLCKAGSICHNAESMIEKAAIYAEINDFVFILNDLFGEGNTDYRIIGQDMKYDEDQEYANILMKWSDNIASCKLGFTIVYARTKSGKIIATKIVKELSDLLELHHPLADDAMIAWGDDPEFDKDEITVLYMTEYLNTNRTLKSVSNEKQKVYDDLYEVADPNEREILKTLMEKVKNSK